MIFPWRVSRRRAIECCLAGATASLAGLAAGRRAARARQAFTPVPIPSPRSLVQQPHPAGFTPLVGQTMADGATIAALLAQQRHVLLVVQRFQGDLQDASADVSLVGSVPLGMLAAGVSFVRWDYTVNGQVLVPGTYTLHLVPATDADIPTGAFPPAPYVLSVGGDGSVQASPANYLTRVIDQDGTVTVQNLDGTPYSP